VTTNGMSLIGMCQTTTVHDSITHRLLVNVLRPTQHKVGHFGDVSQANLLPWYGKNKT